MEIAIRCLGCHATIARGGLTILPTQDEAVQLAQHNPGCPINRTDHRTMVHVEDVLSFHFEEEKRVEDRKTVYTLIVFPGYRD